MKLKSTRLEYEFADASGYRFTVLTERDPEYGWSATVWLAYQGNCGEQLGPILLAFMLTGHPPLLQR